MQGSAHHRLDDVAQDADEEDEEDQSKQGGHGGHGHGSEVYIHLDRYSLQWSQWDHTNWSSDMIRVILY